MTKNIVGFPAHICAGLPVNIPQQSLQLSPLAIIVDDRLPCFLETEPGEIAVKICWNNNRAIYAEPIDDGNYTFCGRYLYSDHPSFLDLFNGVIPYHE